MSIDPKWYDLLVLEGNDVKLNNNVPLDGNSQKFHIYEVKSHKEDSNSFGAFSIGEWLAGQMSLLTNVTFDHTIMYMKHNGTSVPNWDAEYIPTTEELLDDLLVFLHIKLYFHKSFVDKHFKFEGAERALSLNRQNTVNPVLSQLTTVIREALVGTIKDWKL